MVRNYSEKGYQKISFSTVPICQQFRSVFLVTLLTKNRFIWLCKRIPKEKRKELWDKVSKESAYENAFPIEIQFRLERISAFHTEKLFFKKYFITYILRVSGVIHLLKLVDKFISIIFPGRLNSPYSAMDLQSYLSAIAFPPVFIPFFLLCGQLRLDALRCLYGGIFPSSGCLDKHFCAHSHIWE